MMNAELFSKKISTIIIPNVYREDYLSAPYPKVLSFLQRSNWFSEPSDAKIVEDELI